jgi:hypothetical protein
MPTGMSLPSFGSATTKLGPRSNKNLPLREPLGKARMIYRRSEVIMRIGATRSVSLRDLGTSESPPGMEMVN